MHLKVIPYKKELAELHFNDWILAYMRGETDTNDARTL